MKPVTISQIIIRLCIAAVGIGLIIALSIYGLNGLQREFDRWIGAPDQAQPAVRSAFVPDVRQSARWAPVAWRDHVTSRYRLTPDARFLRAAAWLAGTEDAALSDIEYRGDAAQWRFSLGGHVIVLDETPDFGALYAMLREMVAPVAISTASDRMPMDERSLDMGVLLAELDRIDELGGVRGRPRAAARAARALALLLLMQDRSIAIGEPLAVRALATLAIGESGGFRLPLARSIVAYELGYTARARAIARSELARTHPWRRYLAHELHPIGDQPTALEAYLELLRLAYSKETAPAWRQAARQALRHGVGPLAVALTAYGLDDFGPGHRAMTLVPYLALEAAGGDSDFGIDMLTASPREPEVREVLTIRENLSFREQLTILIQRAWRLYEAYTSPKMRLRRSEPPIGDFEEAVASDGPGDDPGDGHWLSGLAVRRATLGAVFYSAIDRRLHFYLYTQSSERRALALVNLLADEPGHVAPTLARIYRHLLGAEQGTIDRPDVFLADLAQLPLGRSRVLSNVFNSALIRLSWDEGVRAGAYRRFAGVDVPASERLQRVLNGRGRRPLDARPVDLETLLSRARSTLTRPLLVRRLRSAVIDVQGRLGATDAVLQRARRTRDLEALRAFAEERQLSLLWRAMAINAIADAGHRKEAYRRFERLVALDPGNWEVREEWINLLREDGRTARVREIARTWYEQYADHRGTAFDTVDAVIADARAAMAAGDLQAALERARWVWQATGAAREYRLTIDVLRASGRKDAARKVAKRLRDAYPNSFRAVIEWVRADWCLGRYDEAAEALAAYGPEIRVWDWDDEAAPAFAVCFAKRPEAAAQATEALVRHGADDWGLFTIAEYLDQTGHPAAAHAVVSSLHPANRLRQMMYDVRAAGYLIRVRGPAVAATWLKERYPRLSTGMISEPIYASGAHEFLWRVVPTPRRQLYRHGVWLLRADSIAIGRTGGTKRRRRAEAYFRKHRDGFYPRLGRMVLGLAPPASIGTRPLSPERLVEATYQLAVRAVGDGRPRDAVRWFVACLAAARRSPGETEFRWAQAVMVRVAGDPAFERRFARLGVDYLMPWGSDIVEPAPSD